MRWPIHSEIQTGKERPDLERCQMSSTQEHSWPVSTRTFADGLSSSLRCRIMDGERRSMNRSLAYLLSAAAVVVAGVALGVVGIRSRHMMSANASTPVRQAQGSNTGRVVRLASNASPAPPFLAVDLDRTVVSTADWQGKVVLLNFWATWCPACRDEIPQLIGLASRYKDRVIVIGISVDEGPPAQVREFAREMGINYSIIIGTHEIVANYGGVPALPTTFIVSPEGRVVQKHVGLYAPDVYEDEVRALLGLPVNASVEMFVDQGQIFLKNAANATELPGVDFKGLTPEQRRAALKRMNSQYCPCPCKLTVAQCRILDSPCPYSLKIANEILKEIVSGAAPVPSSLSSQLSKPLK